MRTYVKLDSGIDVAIKININIDVGVISVLLWWEIVISIIDTSEVTMKLIVAIRLGDDVSSVLSAMR